MEKNKEGAIQVIKAYMNGTTVMSFMPESTRKKVIKYCKKKIRQLESTSNNTD